ncbi:hypothetical protein PF585_08990 [Lactobacillus delbrueckii]|nr:hypothetical protein [Lactobacillus delbrueckii]
MTKTEKTFSTIIKTVNCLMFLAEAVLICFKGAELVGFQTKAKDLTIGWSLIIASVALVLAAILIWTSKFSVLFWITEVALLASFIILTIFRIMDVGTAFDILSRDSRPHPLWQIYQALHRANRGRDHRPGLPLAFNLLLRLLQFLLLRKK